MIMTNYWDKIGRKLNKKERFNYMNNRIDELSNGTSGEEGEEESLGKISVAVKVHSNSTISLLTFIVSEAVSYPSQVTVIVYCPYGTFVILQPPCPPVLPVL